MVLGVLNTYRNSRGVCSEGVALAFFFAVQIQFFYSLLISTNEKLSSI